MDQRAPASAAVHARTGPVTAMWPHRACGRTSWPSGSGAQHGHRLGDGRLKCSEQGGGVRCSGVVGVAGDDVRGAAGGDGAVHPRTRRTQSSPFRPDPVPGHGNGRCHHLPRTGQRITRYRTSCTLSVRGGRGLETGTGGSRHAVRRMLRPVCSGVNGRYRRGGAPSGVVFAGPGHRAVVAACGTRGLRHARRVYPVGSSAPRGALDAWHVGAVSIRGHDW